MRFYKPMQAGSADTPPVSGDWIYEVKWDGIRAISYVNEELSIRSRNNKELKRYFPELEELKDLCHDVVLDGEIIIMRHGKTDFQVVVERTRQESHRAINTMEKKYPATYVVFDILEKGGESRVGLPLIERKKLLKESLEDGDFVVKSLFAEEGGKEYFKAALEKGMEGILAKKMTSPYVPGKRTKNWLKIKKIKTCDCVIFGYTKGQGNRKDTFGALILGLFQEKRPVYVGKVGTGFSQEDLEELKDIFKSLETGESGLGDEDIPRGVTWLKPLAVCRVGYQVLTRDGRLRMPRFKGLRFDKPPEECTTDQLGSDPLMKYHSKRDFEETGEPAGSMEEGTGNSFVVHEHHARRLHFDLRLERDGVLKSWAVPKGPPEVPGKKRLAVMTEDHPLEYGKFEGTIPEGQYGAGTVIIWDKGYYQPIIWGKNKIEFLIHGEKLMGRYVLVKFKKAGEKDWILFKVGD